MDTQTMSHPPFGWRPGDRVPMPPPDTNGWGRWVTASIIHLSTSQHFLEKTQDFHSDHIAFGAPTTKQPAESIWRERTEMTKAIGTGLKWLAAVLLLAGLIAKKIDPNQLPMLKSWFGMPG